MLCYVDGVLVVSHKPQRIMDTICKSFTLKPDNVKLQDLHLGATISELYISGSEDGDTPICEVSSDDYVKSTSENFQTKI